MEKFINLKRAHEGIGMSIPEKAPEPMGPTFYINGVELPLNVDDLGKEKTATIKYKLKDISENVHNGDRKTSYDLEVLEIKL